jgi:putative endonuclease
MKDHNYYVYILTNWNNKVMYIGITNDLERRLYEHKNKLVDGFTKKYNVNKLVYYEHGNDVHAVIAREKEIKKWRREKKDKLVITMNPEWKDLSSEWQASPRDGISTSTGALVISTSAARRNLAPTAEDFSPLRGSK